MFPILLTADVAGRSVSSGEWAAANTYVNTWAKSQDGAFACAAAVQGMRRMWFGLMIVLLNVYSWSHEARFQTAPSLIAWSIVSWQECQRLTLQYIASRKTIVIKPIFH